MQIGYHFAAKSKKDPRPEDAPTQVPMAPRDSSRTSPSTDQLKARRKMAAEQHGNEHAEEGMNPNQIEAQLLAAMAKAPYEEQRKIAEQLNTLRAERTAKINEDRSMDLYTEATFTTPLTDRYASTDSDWLLEEPNVDLSMVQRQMAAHASKWYGQVDPFVKRDATEYQIQAKGMASYYASQYAPHHEAAADTFVRQALFLNRTAADDDKKTDDSWAKRNWSFEQEEADSADEFARMSDPDLVKDDDDSKKSSSLGQPLFFSPFLAGGRTAADDDKKQEATDVANAVSDFGDNHHFPPNQKSDDPDPLDKDVVKDDDKKTSRRVVADDDGGGDEKPFPWNQEAPSTENEGEVETDVHNDNVDDFDWDAFDNFAPPVAPENASAVQEEGDKTPMPGLGESVSSRTAADGNTCSVCGDSITRDPEGEENRTWHHTDGTSHDHEAKPSGDDKQASRSVMASLSPDFRMVVEAAMSRQHYVQVANILSQHAGKDGHAEITRGLGDMFAKDNPRFDRDRFHEAAGLKKSGAKTADDDKKDNNQVEWVVEAPNEVASNPTLWQEWTLPDEGDVETGQDAASPGTPTPGSKPADYPQPKKSQRRVAGDPKDEFYLVRGDGTTGGGSIVSGPHSYDEAKEKMRNDETDSVSLMQGTHPLLPKKSRRVQAADLDPFEQWMVRSNVEHIDEYAQEYGGPEGVVQHLRDGGYSRVADGVAEALGLGSKSSALIADRQSLAAFRARVAARKQADTSTDSTGLSCDGGTGACSGPITMIDDKGYIYCDRHGSMRDRPCRKLTQAELETLRGGGMVKSFSKLTEASRRPFVTADYKEHDFRCQTCGATVTTWGGYDTECPRCGQPYNAFGQRLRDDYAGNPSNYDEDIDDMTGYEMQHAHDGSRHQAAAYDASNWDIGELALWINNDQELYNLRKRMSNASELNDIVGGFARSGALPEALNVNWNKIDWDEVFDLTDPGDDD